MMWIKAVIIFTALLSTNCIHGQDVITEDFFPFGTEVGDAELPPNDDGGSEAIVLATPFRFFNSSYSNLFVNTNGLLSFNGVVSQYQPEPFPIASRPVLAGFWADVDIRTAGHVYYREVVDDVAILARMSDAVRSIGLYNFQATWGFIATYSGVAAFPTDSRAINYFQIVLVADGTHSFTIYNYGLLQWSAASSQSGIDAQVGFDAGDGVNFFAVPTSRTPEIININMESNIGRPGRWMFCIHGQDVITEDFFPFGTEVGDAELPPNDDGGSEAIVLATPFPFFDSSYSRLFVNTNGLLSFNGIVSQYQPEPFPIASRPVIAGFWADVDIRTAGHVYYRELADDAAILARMSDAVRLYDYNFQATWGFIATYSGVPAYAASSSAINYFQIVLVTDGTRSFTIYNYGLLQWSAASSQSGVDAQVGFDAGDEVNFFAVPTSRTPEIININKESNIGRPGRWMFRLDAL